MKGLGGGRGGEGLWASHQPLSVHMSFSSTSDTYFSRKLHIAKCHIILSPPPPPPPPPEQCMLESCKLLHQGSRLICIGPVIIDGVA